MKKPIALVLGGTAPHVLLVNKLHERGYYVVLIDYLSNPPAKRVADEHIQASTLDKEIVLQISKERNASLVISTCIDQANSVCCYVAEKLNLPHPYSYETSLLVTNKGMMKAQMMEYDVPTSKYILTKAVEDVDWSNVSFPCVIKPVDCNSSKGVHRADSVEEAKPYVEEAIRLSQTSEAIIEGFCPGDEIQVDCVALDGDADVVMTRSKVKMKWGEGAVLNSIGSIVPAQVSEKLIPELKTIAQKIAQGFGLKNTPFFYQAIVTGDKVNVLEFAPRVGGGLSYYMIKNFVGFDAVEAAVDSFLGIPISKSYHAPEKIYRSCLLYSKPCTFDHVEGVEELKEKGIIKEFFITKSKGDVIDGDMRSSNRVASFIVEANNIDELQNNISLCLSHVRVIDVEGNNLAIMPN
ncbi:MAG: ATP-grasp domain-containing protein [Bacteroidales bacterium]|jgi:formate-dependent phosphoribosylglycinamide formyltransferase (GAR transformylase)|nr:ATP-grasp domain-containing protein [Bacteroidales bacterium]